MYIDFFETETGLDKDALDGGVYLINLLSMNNNEIIHLYVGESGCIVKRCAKHLQMVFDNPIYFGLEPEDLESESLLLKFLVCEKILEIKGKYNVGNYKNEEKTIIDRIHPLTQVSTSDRMKSCNKKRKDVQDAMKQKYFK